MPSLAEEAAADTKAKDRAAVARSTALVTGGLRGIGRSTALALARAGFAVGVVDQDQPNAASPMELESAVARCGMPFLYRRADVTVEASIGEAIAQLIEARGSVDVLVNNAGVGRPPLPIEQVPLDEWNEIVALNLTSAFLCARAVVPAMKARGAGSIINVSSQAGRSRSEIGNLPYAAAKAGILGFTRQLAGELGPFGIRVNAVAPGLTLNERVEKRLNGLSEQQRQAMTAAVPLGRLARPAEIAAVIAFLASDAASYITGATVDINGGRFML